MVLSKEQKIIYLANVIAVIRADGQITPVETAAVETVQKSINARKTELNKAYREAENPEFDLIAVGNWSDKIKNLEDIIYASMIDGSIDSSEKQLLLSFAKQVKISQDQLNTIIGDVKNAVTASAELIICPGCKEEIEGSAKFCPKCGSEIKGISKSKSVAVSYDIPKTGIAIEFSESTASGFAHAVRDHQAAPISATCVRGKKTWYLASWPKDSISQALKLVENLKGMRNRKVYVDGEELQWNDAFGFAWCANSRNSAYRPNEYCFGLDEKQLNTWGCKQARMDWTEWADWFGYGTFKQNGMLKSKVSFVFDKKRIRHELESNLFKCRLCPHLQFKLIESVLDNLPSEVTPSEKGPWHFKRDYSESPGSILVKAKTKEGGYSYTDEYHSSGVVPSSVNTGLEILRKAFKDCNYPITEIKGVLDYKE